MTMSNGHPRGYQAVKGLAKQLGWRIPELLTLHPKNDPFFAGSPAQQARAEWFSELWQQLQLQHGVHLRRIHYRLLSLDGLQRHDGKPYENTDTCWDYLTEASKAARHLGLVAPDDFDDHRNPPPRRLTDLARPDEEPGWRIDDVLRWRLPRISTDLAGELHFVLPKVWPVGYGYSEGAQPYVLECWVEKSTVDDVLLPVCEELGITLVTSVGFQSISSVIRLLKRVAASGKPARIWYISDFDPAGDSMPVSVVRQIEYYRDDYAPRARIKLTPLALRRDQVVSYRLPRTPIKESDLRRYGFEERYGEGAVELDALEALFPGELATMLREAASPYVDSSLRARRDDAWWNAQDRLNSALLEAATEEQGALDAITTEARTILDQYQERLSALATELDEALAPLQERLKTVRLAVQERLDALEVELPDCPEPSVTVPGEWDWLFDADRDYLDQLAVYKAHKGGIVPNGTTHDQEG